jgi:three-Cys-motif partner protein
MAHLGDYADREQAWVKHWVLEKYLEVLIFKIGGGRTWSRFVYIDAFAGPWGSRREDLSDTSFGRAIAVMKACQAKLAEQGKTLQMEAVFFEANRRRAARLTRYAQENKSASLGIQAYHADFIAQIDAIASQISDKDFALVLIDPTGYKEVAPARFAPLLAKRGVELLINLMWDFINRFWEFDQEKEKLDAIFGADRPRREDVDNLERTASGIYTQGLKTVAGTTGGRLWAATVPVENPDKERTHYFLVYATHSPVGLIAFGHVAEGSRDQQAQAKASKKVRQRCESGQGDIFGGDVSGVRAEQRINTCDQRNAWLKRIPVAGDEIAVSCDTMAELQEECGCLPCDLQAAVRELTQEGIVEVRDVSDTQMKRRTKNAIQYEKRERLRRLK